jgi:hypothetical protein
MELPMARRAKRVKLSRTQQLENDRNRALAKKDALITSLCKVMAKLKELQRSQARMQKATIVRPEAPPQSSTPIAKKKTLGESCDTIVSAMVQGKSFESVQEAAEELAKSDVPRLSAKFPLGKHAKLPKPEQEKAVQLAERMKSMGFRKSGRRKPSAPL